MRITLLLLSLASASVSSFSVGDIVHLDYFATATAPAHPRCLSLPGMIFGAVSSNNGSSLIISCFSVRFTTDTPLPVERSLYDSSELRSFTIEELIDLWGSEAAKTSACAGQSTCSGCTAFGNCRWCSGQQACKPAHTKGMCTQGFYTVQQCKQRVSQTTNWYGRLADSDKFGLYVTFIFTPAKRFFSSWEHNAIGIYVGPTQATATTPVMLRQQRTESGAQGCVDQLGSQPTNAIALLPLALCNFDRRMEYTLYVASGSVGLVDMVSVSTSSGYHHAFGGPIPTSGFWRLAMLGGAISDIYLVTKEEVFVRGHFKKGATRAVEGVVSRGLCPEGEAECGDKCWTVCTDCGPPRYCMCYPNGFTGVSGAWHEGAYCLKSSGGGVELEEEPALLEGGLAAYEEL